MIHSDMNYVLRTWGFKAIVRRSGVSTRKLIMSPAPEKPEGGRWFYMEMDTYLGYELVYLEEACERANKPGYQ